MATDPSKWWVFDHIKEYASRHGLDLSNLIAELDIAARRDQEQVNVIEFTPDQFLDLNAMSDGTFLVMLNSVEPFRCHTVILQKDEPCLAVL